MEIYSILVVIFVLTFVQGDETELGIIDAEGAKKFLQNDEVTVKIVQELLNLNFNSEVKAIMHMMFNHLLIVRWLFSHDEVELRSMPQFPQLDFERIVDSLATSEEKTAFKLESSILTKEIADSINPAFSTNYSGGVLTLEDQIENLANVLPPEEMISPLRFGTIHTLVSEFLGTLMLSHSETFSVFGEDKISFSKEYWSNILRAYPAEDRTYLGKLNALFIIIKFSLQTLAQVRLMRVETHPRLTNIEEKLDSVLSKLKGPASQGTQDNLIRTLYEKVQSAVADGCSGSGDNWPEYEDDENHDDQRVTRETIQLHEPGDILHSTVNHPNCSHHIDITPFKKYLRKCPNQAVEIPQELRNLGFHSRQIDESLSTIQSTLRSIETDELMVKVTEISDFISEDLEEIQGTLEGIQVKYNASLKFFETFDRTLHNLEVVYTDYNLFILWYLALAILGILLLAKFVNLTIYCVHCWPNLTSFFTDFSEYRRVRMQEDETMIGGNNFELSPHANFHRHS